MVQQTEAVEPGQEGDEKKGTVPGNEDLDFRKQISPELDVGEKISIFYLGSAN